MAAIWLWHIIAGIVGVLISLSVVYQKFESYLNPHRQIQIHDVAVVKDGEGCEYNGDDALEFVQRYSQSIYLGRLRPTRVKQEEDVTIVLRTGEEVAVAFGQKYHEVRKTKRNRKVIYYGLSGDLHFPIRHRM